MSWRLARSLEKLREQINAAHPDRSKVSDGSIGDVAHSARKSDHNPNSAGVVTAIDITHDPDKGVDGHTLSRQLAQDSRTKYVIFAGEIYRTYKPELGWAKYTGTNRHDKHVHISVLGDKYDDAALWGFGAFPKSFKRSTLRFGDTGSAVAELQKALGVRADASFGSDTLRVVKEFQRDNGLSPDGVAGQATWGKLRELGRIT